MGYIPFRNLIHHCNNMLFGNIKYMYLKTSFQFLYILKEKNITKLLIP